MHGAETDRATWAAPGLIDRYLARTGYRAPFTSEPQRPGLAGNQFRPGQGHAVHGRFSERARPRLVAFGPAALRALVGSAAALGLLAVAAALRRRR